MMRERMYRLITSLFAVMFTAMPLAAQNNSTGRDYGKGWYVGAQAGMPMAEGDFSSFGADKFRPGWSAGIHGGYRLTRVWSLEMTANWGQQFLAEQECCSDRGYFLGTDHNRYRIGYTLSEGMQGWYYKDLKSRTFVQRYGLQVNMNILGFFNRTRESRWRVELSPTVYAVGTSSDLMTKADNKAVAENLNDWHLGYGGQAQVAYAFAENMNIGIYGGFTHLTGKPMDGMPELHSTNFIIDAGVKFSFAFGKQKRGKSAATVVPAVVAPAEPAGQPREEAKEVGTALVEKADDAVTVEETPKKVATTATATEQPEEKAVVTHPEFPVIRFSFNSVWIEPDEKAKLKEIADRMKADETIRIRITGWADKTGSEEANKRVSLQRAEAVKRALVKRLIPAGRIETVGGGIKHDATSEAEARIATTINIKEYR